jgi:hypothetical protein
MALSYVLVLVLVMTAGIITFLPLSTVLGNQVFATNSDDENQDDDDNDRDNGNGGSSSNDNSLLE